MGNETTMSNSERYFAAMLELQVEIIARQTALEKYFIFRDLETTNNLSHSQEIPLAVQAQFERLVDQVKNDAIGLICSKYGDLPSDIMELLNAKDKGK